jgi:hypothetical protein
MPRPNSRDPETDPRAFLGEELARARVAAGFSSQQALADHLGFDRPVVGKAESGGRPPTAEVLSPGAVRAIWIMTISLGWRRLPGARTGRSSRGSWSGWRRNSSPR